MKIIFLGTGTSQGVPPIGCNSPVCLSNNPKDKRLRSSVLIQHEGKNILIDSGPDFRYQILRAQIQQLDAIVFTHEHRDHTAGLDDIRAFNFIQNRPMDVYCSKQVFQKFQCQFDYIFESHPYPGIPQINWNIIDSKPFLVQGIPFVPIQVLHYKLPVFGYRVLDFTYITDANYISEEELLKVKKSKVLVLNALRREEHISHFTLDQAVAIAQKTEAEQVYFTHMSHQIGFHDEVNEYLPSNMELAYDGLEIIL